MGEQKQEKQPLLSPQERADMLGTDPFSVAYDLIYGMAESVFAQTGGVNHELIGLDFQGGKIVGAYALPVSRLEDAPNFRDAMLVGWPMVAHVFEAWTAPDATMPAHAHPNRQDVVVIMLHTQEDMVSSRCLVDPEKRTIRRGEMEMPIKTAGLLGRDIPGHKMNS